MSIIQRLTVAAIYLSGCSFIAAQVEEKLREREIKEVAITGKTSLKNIKEKAYNVSVIDGEKFKTTTLDVGHALDKASGIRVRETGGVGSDMNVSLNGFRGKQVKFFLDGIPLENIGSSFQINNIPMNLAERIEIYKGVVPVSLGSDALGGAVNIISNSYKKSHLDASYSYGSFNTHKSSVNAVYVAKSGFVAQANIYQNYSDNDYKIQVDVADINTGEYFPNQTVRRFHDKYHNEMVMAKVGVVNKNFADQFLVGINLGKNYKEIQTGARMVSVFGDIYRKGDIIMPTLSYQKKNWFIPNLDFRFNANMNFGSEQNIDIVHRRYNWFGQYKEYSGPGGERGYSKYKFKNNNASAVANWDYKFGNHHSVSLNSTYTNFNRKGYDELSPQNKIYNNPQKTFKNVTGLSYQYAEDNFNLSAFSKSYYQVNRYLQSYNPTGNYGDVAYRDYNSDFKYIGYGATATYFVTKNFQAKASAEKSYRLPENDELYGDLINLQGNISLKPESSINVNGGLSYWLNWSPKNQLNLTVNGFYRDAKDFIQMRLNTNQTMQVMDNLGKVQNLGVEGELNYTWNKRLSVGANATYQNLRNMTEFENNSPSVVYKDRIPNMPYLYGNADISYSFPNIFKRDGLSLLVGYNFLYVHEFPLYWSSLGKDKLMIPTQMSHDLNIALSFKQKWQASLEVRNIFDEKLYDNFSLQKPGRFIAGKIKYSIF